MLSVDRKLTGRGPSEEPSRRTDSSTWSSEEQETLYERFGGRYPACLIG